MSLIRKAVIDTGPLLSALVLHYQRERGPRTVFEDYLEEPLVVAENQEQFLRLLMHIGHKLTTSHAIAEMQGLAKSRLKLSEGDRVNFWKVGIELLMYWNLDEKLIRLAEMASQPKLRTRLPEIGIVDTGLIELAAKEGCLLITNDERTMAPRAAADQIECRLVKQLIPQL